MIIYAYYLCLLLLLLLLLFLYILCHLGLEGAVEVCEEGVLPGQRQHPPLHQGALHVVVHQHHVFLQGLHGEELTGALQLRQEHLQDRRLCSHHLGTDRQPNITLREQQDSVSCGDGALRSPMLYTRRHSFDINSK